MSRYSFGKTVDTDFEQTIERVTQALAKEGFGVLSDIARPRACRVVN